jgi:predicted TIM-barrel fold metal-dependent hydrolase
MDKPMVIDIHTHGAGIGAGGSGCHVAPQLRNSWKFRFYLRAFGVTFADLERDGDMLVLQGMSARLAAAQHVHKAVVFALDGVINGQGHLDLEKTELYIPNAFIAQACREHNNLLFGASVNPRRRDALEQLDAAVADGAVLLKWLPSIQGIDPADPALIPFYKRLVELKLLLLSHTGNEESFTRTDNRLADPERLRLPLEQGVTVIAAHCASNGRNGGESNFGRFLSLAAAYPHLHADISALTQINRLGHLQRVLARPELHSRLHFGTDMPLPCTGLTSPWFQVGRIPLSTIRRLSVIDNPWDLSLQLKLALGLPQTVLGNTPRLLRLI